MEVGQSIGVESVSPLEIHTEFHVLSRSNQGAHVMRQLLTLVMASCVVLVQACGLSIESLLPSPFTDLANIDNYYETFDDFWVDTEEQVGSLALRAGEWKTARFIVNAPIVGGTISLFRDYVEIAARGQLAAAQTHHTVAIQLLMSHATESDTVCDAGQGIGSFVIKLDDQLNPAGFPPEDLELVNAAVDILESGGFALCLRVTTSFDATVTIGELMLRLEMGGNVQPTDVDPIPLALTENGRTPKFEPSADVPKQIVIVRDLSFRSGYIQPYGFSGARDTDNRFLLYLRVLDADRIDEVCTSGERYGLFTFEDGHWPSRGDYELREDTLHILLSGHASVCMEIQAEMDTSFSGLGVELSLGREIHFTENLFDSLFESTDTFFPFFKR